MDQLEQTPLFSTAPEHVRDFVSYVVKSVIDDGVLRNFKKLSPTAAARHAPDLHEALARFIFDVTIDSIREAPLGRDLLRRLDKLEAEAESAAAEASAVAAINKAKGA